MRGRKIVDSFSSRGVGGRISAGGYGSGCQATDDEGEDADHGVDGGFEGGDGGGGGGDGGGQGDDYGDSESEAGGDAFEDRRKALPGLHEDAESGEDGADGLGEEGADFFLDISPGVLVLEAEIREGLRGTSVVSTELFDQVGDAFHLQPVVIELDAVAAEHFGVAVEGAAHEIEG